MSLLFESIHVFNGYPLRLEFHQKRMDISRKSIFGISNPLSLFDFFNKRELPKQGSYKYRIIYGDKIEHIESEKYTVKQLQKFKIVEDNMIEYPFKFLNRENINSLYEKKGECSEIIIVKNGEITDTSIANLAFFDGEKWLSPQTSLLQGTYREFLLKNKQIKLQKIFVSDLQKMKCFTYFNAMNDANFNEPCLVKNIVF